MTILMVKGYKDHNPSLKISDIRLSPGWYLIKPLSLHDDVVENDAGLFIPLGKNEAPPGISKVIKIADEGCNLAKVGDYVMSMTPGGNENDHVKPFPLNRVIGDIAENHLFVIQEKYIPLVIPPAKTENK